MSKKLTVLVDMDGCLDNLLKAWLHSLNEIYGTNIVEDDVTDWDMSAAFQKATGNYALTLDEICEPLLNPDFWDTVEPIPGATEALQKLIADGHKIYIVTASHYQTLAAKMEKVLFRYFPFLTWDDVIVTSNKQLVSGDVLIDDGVHNLTNGSYAKLLMDAPHNRDFEAEANGMTRVMDWGDAYIKICQLLAKEG